ncbi:uncharacterized protein G2W53_041750 [Senna tora]|uniref:Uncharacterized protein n=1 Tax=Senna tora TaxID=362788 RepID=A0A834W366_9FABA|nr:uncharacterized protein G2W53_041750 [Senna tora]
MEKKRYVQEEITKRNSSSKLNEQAQAK